MDKLKSELSVIRFSCTHSNENAEKSCQELARLLRYSAESSGYHCRLNESPTQLTLVCQGRSQRSNTDPKPVPPPPGFKGIE